MCLIDIGFYHFIMQIYFGGYYLFHSITVLDVLLFLFHASQSLSYTWKDMNQERL